MLLLTCLFQNSQHHKIPTPKVGKPHGSVGTPFTLMKMCLSLEHFHALTLVSNLKLRLQQIYIEENVASSQGYALCE